ncbi:hypothetical protein PIROE2DRAFT_11834 [Piromyces sp. E2]|nr:hypothetical protein PIROE2DRAFT_11834 [Piromyces sp. E2]|eukprot:OUM62013.1 hypothetical protein PIROE2DRAFT_11834 [Piromyces sp. E2]
MYHKYIFYLMLDAQCTSDSECPLYSKCGKYSKDGKEYSVCRFGYFICKEKENEPCLYLNTTIWDVENEKVKNNMKIRNINQYNKCITDQCYNDNDCISGKCFLKTCIHDDDNPSVYMCSGENEKYYIKCGLYAGIKSYNSNDCYSSQTKSNICKPPSTPSKNLLYLLLAIGVFILITVIYTLYEKKIKIKNEKMKN